MTDTAKRLVGPAPLTTAAATVYTVPASTTTVLRNVHVANVGVTAYTFTISIGADAVGTRWWAGQTVQPGSYLAWSGFLVLNAADILQAYASTASMLNLIISGVEVS